jgi:hypothetical protein
MLLGESIDLFHRLCIAFEQLWLATTIAAWAVAYFKARSIGQFSSKP